MTTIHKNIHSNAQRCISKSVFAVTGAVCLAIWLSACTSTVPDETPPADDPRVIHDESPAATSTNEEPGDNEELEYNLQRLSDPDYTETYGDGENKKIWYSAAENLGQMGKPAIPHLIHKLGSDDDFEVMLALYALQLASQDAELQAQIGQNYLSLPSVLNPRANAHNRAIALSWWQQYRHLWNSTDD